MPTRLTSVVFGLVLLGGASLWAQPNVLLLIADDLGVDRVGAYGEHPDPGRTPVIDELAQRGVLFRNAYANPVCSTTRATLLTGRYSFRTGIGSIIGFTDTVELSLQEVTLPELLRTRYHSAAVGKWHLSATEVSDADHPMLCGFEHHRGSLSNFPPEQGPGAFYAWEKNVDGTRVLSTTYATTDTVDDALALIAEFGAAPEARPWLLWVSFNAPHKPFHHPPPHLHSFDLPPELGDDPLFMKAAVEAMDTEIGRLLAGLGPQVLAETLVVFLGDNGTTQSATTEPFPPAHAKGTLFEGGINVPLVVAGPGVAAGAECAALVNTTDLFATIAEIAGVPSTAEDSVSLVPYFGDPGRPSQRSWAYAEWFEPDQTDLHATRRRAVRGERYKLTRFEVLGKPTRETLHDLLADPFEQDDLLLGGAPGPEAADARAALAAVLDGLAPPPELPWADHGLALPGTHGFARLAGTGTPAAGERIGLSLRGALPHSVALLFLGASSISKPFKGGALAPAPDLLLLLPLDAAGEIALESSWPPGIPAGFTIHLHAWQPDPAGIAGFAATNAVSVTAE